MALGSRGTALLIAVVLLIGGIVLMLITEPAGEDGGQASGGVSDVSEETRPYLVLGLLAAVVGVAVGVWGFVKGRPA